MSRRAILLAVSVLTIGGLVACRTPLCPNGNPIPKTAKCERVYPAYARAYVGFVSLDLEAAGVKLSDVNAGIASDVKKLRQDYDQITNQLELSLKSICVLSNANRCDSVALERLNRSSDLITAKMGQIRENVSTIEALAERLSTPGLTEAEREDVFVQLREKIKNVRSAAAEASQGIGQSAK